MSNPINLQIEAFVNLRLPQTVDPMRAGARAIAD